MENFPPGGLETASDGDFVLAVGTERQFRRLCDAVLGQPEWASDIRFS